MDWTEIEKRAGAPFRRTRVKKHHPVDELPTHEIRCEGLDVLRYGAVTRNDYGPDRGYELIEVAMRLTSLGFFFPLDRQRASVVVRGKDGVFDVTLGDDELRLTWAPVGDEAVMVVSWGADPETVLGPLPPLDRLLQRDDVLLERNTLFEQLDPEARR